jgi:hypothetical protein
VVKVVVRTATGGGHGTGFIINESGSIVTNHHVIKNVVNEENGQLDIQFFRDRSWNSRYKVIKYDPIIDLALLVPEQGTFEYDTTRVCYLPLKREIFPGQWISTIGNPLGVSDFDFKQGNVTNLEYKDPETDEVIDWKFISNLGLNPGNSGGPILNSRGQVVGVAVAVLKTERFGANATAFNLCIKPEPLFRFLAGHEYHVNEELVEPVVADDTTQKRLAREKAEQQARIDRERRALEWENSRRLMDQNEELRRKVMMILGEHEMAKLQIQQQGELQQLELQNQLQAQRIQEAHAISEANARLAHAESIERLTLAMEQRQKYYRALPPRLSLKVSGGATSQVLVFTPKVELPQPEELQYRLAGYAQFFVGYRFDLRQYLRRSRGTSVGIWPTVQLGSTGYAQQIAMATGNKLQFQRTLLPGWEVEGGLMLREWLRLSGGYGVQHLGDGSLYSGIQYGLITVGITARFGPIELDWTTSTQLFMDLQYPTLRTGLGLSIHQKVGKWGN